MIREGLAAFRGQSVLLLQGPMGPFFWRLAKDLRAVGARVHKVNFNAGDALFFPSGALTYDGRPEDWPRLFVELLDRWQVDVVLLFGDCRPIHASVRELVLSRGRELGVFEEGYVRPDYITLERSGVNGHSQLPRQPGRYRSLERTPSDQPMPVGSAYWHGVVWSTLYATAATLGAARFPAYRHHRPLDAVEALRWIRAIGRKWRHAVQQRGLQDRLCGPEHKNFYLVPLQVHNDAQVRTHSHYVSVGAFIDEVVRSFAAHAPAATLLVLKHHPMDRPYADHAPAIRKAAADAGVLDRVLYIHDQHLPTLLTHARGVVLINSTVGLQALHHGCALKVCGRAIFDMPDLTFQGDLAAFWTEAERFAPDMALFARFHQYLVSTTQINGSFYRRLPASRLASGVRWSPSEAGDRSAGAPAPQAPSTARPAALQGRLVAVVLLVTSVVGSLAAAAVI